MNRPIPDPIAGTPRKSKRAAVGAAVPASPGRAGQFQPGHGVKSQGRINKVRTLPSAIRDEVSRRLEEGHIPREIADWLNTVDEVRQILAEKWQGVPVERRAIDRWRVTGYLDWKRKHEELKRLKELAEFSLKLGQAAGGGVAEGSAAIAGGRIMSLLEAASDQDTLKMVGAIRDLRSGDFTKARLKQAEQKLEQAEQKLELERKRFQRDSAQLFLTWYANKKARDIVESRKDNREKLELLGREIFGDDW